MYQLVCFGVWDKREGAEVGSVSKVGLFSFSRPPLALQQPHPLAAPIPGRKLPESLAAQSLAGGQGIVLVRGEGDDCTSGSSAGSPGLGHTNRGPRREG